MIGTLSVDTSELSQLAGLLDQTHNELQNRDSSRVDGKSVGNTGVANALGDFYTNWDYRRKALAEKLATLSSLLSQAAAQYDEMESALADACKSDGKAASPQTSASRSTAAATAASAGAAVTAAIASIFDLRLSTASSGPAASFANGNETWSRMTQEQRVRLLTVDNADQVAQDPAMPPDVRYAANRYLVSQEKYRLEHKSNLTEGERSRLALYNEILDHHKTVLFFDPSGDGKVAVVEGDLATAKHISVDVAGIGTDMGSYSGMMGEGSRLHRATGSDTAVISWLGYDTPVGLGLKSNPLSEATQIPSEAMAVTGAAALIKFVKGISAGNPSALVTVIGHSYGSLVTGIAAEHGLQANNVVFIGSPGVDATNVNQFHLPPGAQVYAAQFPNDPISTAGYFGAIDHFGRLPTDPAFGAKVVDLCEVPPDPHSHYYGQNSNSLNFLASVVRGDGGAPFVPQPVLYAGPDGIGGSDVA
jgi:pimeloyl-ACP methyl ester carboxylesterase